MKNRDMSLLLANPSKLETIISEFSEAEIELLFIAIVSSKNTKMMDTEYDLMREIIRKLTKEQLTNLAVKYGDSVNPWCIYAIQAISDIYNDTEILHELKNDTSLGNYVRSLADKCINASTEDIEMDILEDKLETDLYTCVRNDWIYYVENNSEFGNTLHKIRTDGTENEKLYSDTCTFWLTVNNDWIYYLFLSANADNRLLTG